MTSLPKLHTPNGFREVEPMPNHLRSPDDLLHTPDDLSGLPYDSRILERLYFPREDVRAVTFFPDGSKAFRYPAEVEPIEETAMEIALGLAYEALEDEHPPVGAVLLKPAPGKEDEYAMWGSKSEDHKKNNLSGHGEQIVIDMANGDVGRDLSDCTLVTTCQLCNSCTTVIAEGKPGRVVAATSRQFVFPLTGIMRKREINCDKLMEDGATSTDLVKGYGSLASLTMLAVWGQLYGKPPEDTGEQRLDI